MKLHYIAFKRNLHQLPLLGLIAVAVICPGISAAAQMPEGIPLLNTPRPVFQGKVIDLLRVNREIERRGEGWNGEGGLDPVALAREGFAPGVVIRARRAVPGRFMLMRYGLNCLALRFTGRSRPAAPPNGIMRAWYGSTYEWFLQEDGSADFGRRNVRSGTGEVFEARSPGDPAKTTILAGPFKLEWSLADWVSYPAHHEESIAMAQSGARSIREIDAHSSQLEWWELRSTIAWGEVLYGLQLGLDYHKAPHVYRAGDIPSFQLLLRNASRRDVKLRRLNPVGLQTEMRLFDSNGRAAQWRHPVADVKASLVEQRLSPGQVVALGPYSFALSADRAVHPDLSVVEASTGLHKLIGEFRFHPWSGLWPAYLTSGALEVEVVEKSIANIAP